MATYVNDLRLKEIATGDESGTWGTSTNTNLELIGEALGFGTEGITTNADTHTTTVADGSTDPGRAMYLKYTGTLDSACTITIAPNTISRMQFIENGTTGSQNIIISQGTGANVTIPAGDTKAVYLDGAGSGAAVVDAFASLNTVDLKVEDDLTVTDDASIGGDATITGTLGVSGLLTANANVTLAGTTPTLTIGDAGAEDTKIVFDGNAQDFYIGLDDSADDLLIGLGSTVGTTPAISIDENVNSTFAGTINGLTLAAGSVATSTSQNFAINTPNSLRINIDSNDSATDQVFVVGHNRTDVGTTSSLLVIQEDGKVGIGTSSPDTLLNLESAAPILRGTDSDDTDKFGQIEFDNGDIVISADANSGGGYQGSSKITFCVDSGTERARINNSGDFLSNTTTAVASFYNGVSGIGFGYAGGGYGAFVRSGTNTPLYVSTNGQGSGGFIEFAQNGATRGNITYTGSATAYNTSSDYRLKENVTPIQNALSKIDTLNPINFDWKESSDNSDGFLAHEAQTVVPYAVTGVKDEVYTDENSGEEKTNGEPKYQVMDYGKLTPLLVKAIQEQQTIIEDLKARIETLEG
jgi:hypothetical protein